MAAPRPTADKTRSAESYSMKPQGRQLTLCSVRSAAKRLYLFSHVLWDVVGLRDVEVKGDVSVHEVCVF